MKGWVINPVSPTQKAELEFLVDSGAIYTIIPKDTLHRLGITPHSQRTFNLADGRQVTWGVGNAIFAIGERQGASTVVVGEDPSQALLGAVTLEELGLGFDPLRKELIPIPLPLALSNFT